MFPLSGLALELLLLAQAAAASPDRPKRAHEPIVAARSASSGGASGAFDIGSSTTPSLSASFASASFVVYSSSSLASISLPSLSSVSPLSQSLSGSPSDSLLPSGPGSVLSNSFLSIGSPSVSNPSASSAVSDSLPSIASNSVSDSLSSIASNSVSNSLSSTGFNSVSNSLSSTGSSAVSSAFLPSNSVSNSVLSSSPSSVLSLSSATLPGVPSGIPLQSASISSSFLIPPTNFSASIVSSSSTLAPSSVLSLPTSSIGSATPSLSESSGLSSVPTSDTSFIPISFPAPSTSFLPITVDGQVTSELVIVGSGLGTPIVWSPAPTSQTSSATALLFALRSPISEVIPELSSLLDEPTISSTPDLDNRLQKIESDARGVLDRVRPPTNSGGSRGCFASFWFFTSCLIEGTSRIRIDIAENDIDALEVDLENFSDIAKDLDNPPPIDGDDGQPSAQSSPPASASVQSTTGTDSTSGSPSATSAPSDSSSSTSTSSLSSPSSSSPSTSGNSASSGSSSSTSTTSATSSSSSSSSSGTVASFTDCAPSWINALFSGATAVSFVTPIPSSLYSGVPSAASGVSSPPSAVSSLSGPPSAASSLSSLPSSDSTQSESTSSLDKRTFPVPPENADIRQWSTWMQQRLATQGTHLLPYRNEQHPSEDAGSSSSDIWAFGNTPVTAAVGPVSGCTVIIVVSQLGVYLAHLFEVTSFKPLDTWINGIHYVHDMTFGQDVQHELPYGSAQGQNKPGQDVPWMWGIQHLLGPNSLFSSETPQGTPNTVAAYIITPRSNNPPAPYRTPSATTDYQALLYPVQVQWINEYLSTTLQIIPVMIGYDKRGADVAAGEIAYGTILFEYDPFFQTVVGVGLNEAGEEVQCEYQYAGYRLYVMDNQVPETGGWAALYDPDQTAPGGTTFPAYVPPDDQAPPGNQAPQKRSNMVCRVVTGDATLSVPTVAPVSTLSGSISLTSLPSAPASVSSSDPTNSSTSLTSGQSVPSSTSSLPTSISANSTQPPSATSAPPSSMPSATNCQLSSYAAMNITESVVTAGGEYSTSIYSLQASIECACANGVGAGVNTATDIYGSEVLYCALSTPYPVTTEAVTVTSCQIAPSPTDFTAVPLGPTVCACNDGYYQNTTSSEVSPATTLFGCELGPVTASASLTFTALSTATSSSSAPPASSSASVCQVSVGQDHTKSTTLQGNYTIFNTLALGPDPPYSQQLTYPPTELPFNLTIDPQPNIITETLTIILPDIDPDDQAWSPPAFQYGSMSWTAVERLYTDPNSYPTCAQVNGGAMTECYFTC